MTCRRFVSYLKLHGHPNAEYYPLGKLLVEVRLTRNEVNQSLAAEAVVTQAAIASFFSKEGQKGFKELIKGLQNDG